MKRRVGRRETNGPLAGKHQAQWPRVGVRPEHQLDAVGAVAPVACEQKSGNAGHPVVRSENLVQLPKLGLSRKGEVGFTPDEAPGSDAWSAARGAADVPLLLAILARRRQQRGDVRVRRGCTTAPRAAPGGARRVHRGAGAAHRKGRSAPAGWRWQTR